VTEQEAGCAEPASAFHFCCAKPAVMVLPTTLNLESCTFVGAPRKVKVPAGKRALEEYIIQLPRHMLHPITGLALSSCFERYIRPVSIGKPNLDCLGNRRHAGEKSKESTVRRQNIGKMGIQSYNRQPRPLRSCYSNRNPHTPGHPISKPPVFMPPIQTPTIPSH